MIAQIDETFFRDFFGLLLIAGLFIVGIMLLVSPLIIMGRLGRNLNPWGGL